MGRYRGLPSPILPRTLGRPWPNSSRWSQDWMGYAFHQQRDGPERQPTADFAAVFCYLMWDRPGQEALRPFQGIHRCHDPKRPPMRGLALRSAPSTGWNRWGCPFIPPRSLARTSLTGHGHAHLLRYPQPHRIRLRLWSSGTTRILLWGDPEMLAALSPARISMTATASRERASGYQDGVPAAGCQAL